jgi:hypothetical protein
VKGAQSRRECSGEVAETAGDEAKKAKDERNRGQARQRKQEEALGKGSPSEERAILSEREAAKAR